MSEPDLASPFVAGSDMKSTLSHLISLITMKKLLFHTATLSVFLLATSCATTTSTLDDPELRRTYSASYDRVFSEAINASALLSWELTHSEKGAGIIQATTPKNMWTNGDAVTIRIKS